MSLYDANTDAYLGEATPEQITASLAETTGTGIILVDATGNVITPGSWDAQQPGAHPVYVQDVLVPSGARAPFVDPVTCTKCLQPIYLEPSVGWVTTLSGDLGGTYDMCEANWDGTVQRLRGHKPSPPTTSENPGQ